MTNDSSRARKIRWTVAGVLPILAAFAFAASTFSRSDAVHGSFGGDEAKQFQGFAVFNAGDSVSGTPLVAVLRRDDAANYVSFIYGKCKNENGNACSPPAEVQTWPACRRHLALYGGDYAPKAERTTIRGVPAAFFEGGRRLEIQTGRSTVVIFGRTRAEVVEIADEIQGVNLGVPAREDLPAPAPGALIGSVACGF